MNVYYAAPLLYQKKDGTVFGVYAISVDVPSVVPSISKLLAVGDNELKVEEWYVALVIAQGNVKSVKYQDFIEFAGERERYDAENIIVTFSSEEMKELADKFEVEI